MDRKTTGKRSNTMKVMKTVTVPAKTETKLDYMQCELCENRSHTEDWSPRVFEIREPTVTFREGTDFPEGSSATTIHLDICPECFKTKLIPWFEAQGGSTRETEQD
jgi:hypothetical protein